MENSLFDNIEGNHIVLNKVKISDAEDIYKWRTGKGGQFLRQPPSYSVESQREWISLRRENEINYIICDKETGKKVGFVGIYDINDQDKVANVGRLVLDEQCLTKSNPYGLEALLLTYDHVLNQMDFRKITGDLLATNTAMFKLQTYLGMKQEGYLKQHVLINDSFVDLYIMSIFRDDFNNSFKKKILFLLRSFQ